MEYLATSDAAEGRLRFVSVPLGIYEARLVDPDLLWDSDAPRVEVATARARRLETWWVRHRGSVAGVVRDAKTRAAIPGARVRVVAPPEAAPVPGGRVPAGEVQSDAQGRFRVDGVAPGDGLRIVARALGRAAVVAGPVTVLGGRIADAGDVLLWPGSRLDVTVVDAAGKGFANATVDARSSRRPAPDPGDPVSAVVGSEGRTDSQGRVTLADLPDGDLQLRVAAPGAVETSILAPDVPVGGTRTVRVVLARTGTLRGRLLMPDGPPPPVEVVALVRGRALVRRATPDAAFQFTIPDLPPEATDLEVRGTGAAAGLVYGRRDGVMPGSEEAIVLPIRGGRVVEGDVDGLVPGPPTPHLRLEVSRTDATDDVRRNAIVLDVALPAGVTHAPFRIPGVPPGVYVLRVVQGGRDSGPVPLLVEARNDVAGVAVFLPDGATVAGEAYDAVRGAGALGARITLVPIEGDATAPYGGQALETVAGDDGRFEIVGVGAGLFRVEAVDRESRAHALVRVAVGASTWVPSLRLTAGGRVEGRLTDDRSRPVAGVPIAVLRLPELVDGGSTRTDEAGRFLSGPLDPARYRVRVSAGLSTLSGLEADVEVTEGETTTVDWTPKDVGRIDGTVRRRATAIPGIAVEVEQVDAGIAASLTRRTLTDAFGQFSWSGLSAGRYRVRLVDGAVTSGTLVDLGPGEYATKDVDLGEGRVSGVVRFADGDPVGDAEVEAVAPAGVADEDGSGRARTRTDTDGTFELPGLTIGRYRLLVTPPGRATRVLDGVYADLPGSERPAEVWIGIGARLEVEVRDDRGRGVGAAEVWVEDARGVALHPHPYVTGPSGRLSVQGLPEVAGRVRVRARGFGRPAPVPVALAEGTPASVRVVVRPGGAVRLTVTAARSPLGQARVQVLRAISGEPVESRRTLRRPDDPSGFGVTPRTGILEISDLEEGDYTIVVTGGRDLAEARVSVRVRPGQTSEVGVALVPDDR